MSAPKSVVKIDKKGGVTYESNVDACQYYLFELSRRALMDVGRFLSKQYRLSLASKIKAFRSNRPKYRVLSSKNTTAPRVEIGLKGGAGSKSFWSAWLSEFGTHDGTIPKYKVLSNTVNNNISKIVEIESQYLSGLSGEASRLNQKIHEEDVEEEAE